MYSFSILLNIFYIVSTLKGMKDNKELLCYLSVAITKSKQLVIPGYVVFATCKNSYDKKLACSRTSPNTCEYHIS